LDRRETFWNIPRRSYEVKKDELLELIERAMDDIEKLDTIRHKASE